MIFESGPSLAVLPLSPPPTPTPSVMAEIQGAELICFLSASPPPNIYGAGARAQKEGFGRPHLSPVLYNRVSCLHMDNSGDMAELRSPPFYQLSLSSTVVPEVCDMKAQGPLRKVTQGRAPHGPGKQALAIWARYSMIMGA